MLRENLIANLAGRFWAVFSVYLFVPLYVNLVGIDGYGIIAFYATLSSVILIADGGLTAVMSRQLAINRTSSTHLVQQANFVTTIERTFFVIAALLTAIMLPLSQWIAEGWMKSAAYSIEETTDFVSIMIVSAAFQLIASNYFAGLTGIEKQVLSNWLQFGWSCFRSIGGVIVFWFNGDLEYFLGWQLVCNAGYAAVLRYYLKKHAVSLSGRFDLRLLKSISGLAIGFFAITLISIVNLQSDKLIVSHLLGIADFGLYSIAYTAAQAPLVLATPISSALQPRLIGYVNRADQQRSEATYVTTFELMSLLCIPASVAIAFFSFELIYLWNQSLDIALVTQRTASLLVVGSLLLAMQIPSFNLAVAHGKTSINLWFGVVFASISVAGYFFAVPLLGISGAGWVWLLANLVCTPLYIIVVNQQLGSTSSPSILRVTSMILILSLVIFGAVKFFVPVTNVLLFLITMSLAFPAIVYLYIRLAGYRTIKQFIFKLS